MRYLLALLLLTGCQDLEVNLNNLHKVRANSVYVSIDVLDTENGEKICKSLGLNWSSSTTSALDTDTIDVVCTLYGEG